MVTLSDATPRTDLGEGLLFLLAALPEAANGRFVCNFTARHEDHLTTDGDFEGATALGDRNPTLRHILREGSMWPTGFIWATDTWVGVGTIKKKLSSDQIDGDSKVRASHLATVTEANCDIRRLPPGATRVLSRRGRLRPCLIQYRTGQYGNWAPERHTVLVLARTRLRVVISRFRDCV
jgi:hypothetical protein